MFHKNFICPAQGYCIYFNINKCTGSANVRTMVMQQGEYRVMANSRSWGAASAHGDSSIWWPIVKSDFMRNC